MVGKGRLARGELEALVMDVCWSSDESLTPGEVHERLAVAHPVAYTTVMTILVRLEAKGTLERKRVGRAYAYRPTATREVMAARRMAEILESAGDASAALTHFVEGIDASDARALRRILDRKGRR